MKIYLINLDKNSDRLRDVDARLKKLGVVYERIPAVYGKVLSEAELKASKRRFRMWCAVGYDMAPGQVGCALSQIAMFEKMLSDGESVCCCLEDDVTPDERFPEQLKRVANWIDPANPQVVLLTNYTSDKESSWCIKPTAGDTSSEAFVITAPAARNIIRANKPIAVPADWWRYWQAHGLIELYHAFPTVFGHEWMYDEGYRSDVCTVSIRHPGIQIVFWKMKRLIGKILDRIIPL